MINCDADCVKCKCVLELELNSNREALIALNSLSVDKEPSRSCVIKKIEVNQNKIIVQFFSNEARGLRASVNNFMDLFILVKETINRFDYNQMK
jgi:1110049G11Rik protein, putative